MKKIFIFSLLVLCTFNVQSQISTSYYATMNFSKISVGYDFNDRWWGDMRLFGGCDLDRLYIEPVLLYNFKAESQYSVYGGAGFSIGKYDIMAIAPLGVRVKPIQTNEHLLLHFELQPTFNFHGSDVDLYYYIGLRYLFNKN